METDLRNVLKGHTNRITLVLLAIVAGIFCVLFNTPPAHASGSTTSCGQAVCYVDSTVRSESNWASEPYTATDGTTHPGSSSGSSGSGSSQPKSMSAYRACDSWLPVNGGQSTSRYPAQNSSSMNCHFSDGGAVGGGTGVVWYMCPPQGDRASNGRVTYYVERVYENGTTAWVYARYRCLYPTDAYAPIERETARGKVYTGGEANFYQTTAPQATQATRSGVRTSASGYINRGVNLSNPEAWVGAWSPAFSARTGTTAAGAPLYGYYRLLWELDYRICVRYEFPAWLGQPARYDCGQVGRDTTVEPFTFACDTNPPLQRGVRPGALFNASDCVPSWECQLSGDTTVGGTPDRLTVIRNGQPIPVTFATPTVRILDPARVRDVRDWKTWHTITPGSTPSSQYVKSSWVWDRWVDYRATGTIAFNWASDSESQPFSWGDRYRFTADYLVPTQSAVDGSVSYVWVASTRDCLSSDTPLIDVVRSANR